MLAWRRSNPRVSQRGRHRVGAPLRDRYARFVELANKGARELGFANLGTQSLLRRPAA
jgi:hypothetical protein